MTSGFSWSGAVLSGWRVLSREPSVLLLWTLVALVFGLADQVLAVRYEILRTTGYSGTWLPPLISIVRGVIATIGMAIFSAAAYRTVLRPQGEARGRMRFGADELRLTLVWMLMGLLLVALSIGGLVVAFSYSTTLKPGAMHMGIVGTGLALGLLLFWIVLVLRLSLAAPMTLAEGRWSGPAAWRMTKGHAWKILAVHLPILLGVGLIFSVTEIVYAAALSATHIELGPSILRRVTSPEAIFEPKRLGLTFVTAILSAAAAAMFYAPGAYIYGALKGDEPADQAAVFD